LNGSGPAPPLVRAVEVIDERIAGSGAGLEEVGEDRPQGAHSLNRRMGTGPSVPWRSPPIRSASIARKIGSTSSHDQRSLPRPTQRSKSVLGARHAFVTFVEDDPPITFPRYAWMTSGGYSSVCSTGETFGAEGEQIGN
jgi:hypothetical protein